MRFKLKHTLLGNRYTVTAVLFVALILIGGIATLAGVLQARTACGGYLRPAERTAIAKTDPTRPSRDLTAPATALKAPGKREPLTKTLLKKTAAAEGAVTKALETDHTFIELYGAFERLTGRTVVEDTAEPQYSVVRLPDETLTFAAVGSPDARAQAAELKRLQLAVEARDGSLLYVQAPYKLESEEELPVGVEDNGNACADALLAALEEAEVDYLDLRTTFRQSGMDWSHWFYGTDHHWNQEGAFLAFKTIAKKLEDYDQAYTDMKEKQFRPIEIDKRYTDRESYERTALPAFFLGSQGKRVGSLYVGSDDFILWEPKFPTLMSYTARKGGYGTAADTILYAERVEEKDWYNGNPYTFYAGGDYGAARIINYYNPTGPKVLLVRESFACALTPYLAYACSELTTLDCRYFTGDMSFYLDWLEPDVVIYMLSAGSTREESHFRIMAQPGQAAKADVLRWETPLRGKA